MTSPATSTMPAHDYARARFNMVECQIRTNRVTDPRLLAALSEVPRQLFVPAVFAGVAYVDTSLRVQGDRYLQEPLALARLLQEAAVEPTSSALVIGAGTGYSTAILAKIAQTVTAVECDTELASKAKAALGEIGIANAAVQTGPLEQGWTKSGPYDVILIDGMIAALPDKIAKQMAEHGRLVTLEAQDGRCGAGMLYRKLGGAVSGRILFDAAGAFLPGFAPRPAFAL